MGSLAVFDEQAEQITKLLERMRRLFEALDVPYRLVSAVSPYSCTPERLSRAQGD
jgi:hypothetical protein